MADEIEYKYLFNPNFDIDEVIKTAKKVKIIDQAYIGEGEVFVERVRLIEQFSSYENYEKKEHPSLLAELTIKEKVGGAKRLEFEYEISRHDAEQIVAKEINKIEKTRFIIEYAGFDWEVDIFRGKNEGLVVAEIEVPDVNTTYEVPPWVGSNVTEEEKYYNFSLIANPFNKWVTVD